MTPNIRVPRAFEGLLSSDAVSIGAGRTDSGTCLSLASLERCGVGLSRTYVGLLLYIEGPSERAREGLDLPWLVILFFPIGLLGRTTTDLLRRGAVGLVAAIVLTPLLAGPWYEVFACVMGVVLGRLGLLSLRKVADVNGICSVPDATQDVR